MRESPTSRGDSRFFSSARTARMKKARADSRRSRIHSGLSVVRSGLALVFLETGRATAVTCLLHGKCPGWGKGARIVPQSAGRRAGDCCKGPWACGTKASAGCGGAGARRVDPRLRRPARGLGLARRRSPGPPSGRLRSGWQPSLPAVPVPMPWSERILDWPPGTARVSRSRPHDPASVSGRISFLTGANGVFSAREAGCD